MKSSPLNKPARHTRVRVRDSGSERHTLGAGSQTAYHTQSDKYNHTEQGRHWRSELRKGCSRQNRVRYPKYNLKNSRRLRKGWRCEVSSKKRRIKHRCLHKHQISQREGKKAEKIKAKKASKTKQQDTTTETVGCRGEKSADK